MTYTFEDLIEGIRKRPEIWQRAHPRYCNSARKICWKELSKELKAPENQLRRSWKYLVDQYRRELKVPYTSEIDDLNPSVWAYYFHMSFIKNEIITRQTRRKIKIRPNAATLTHNTVEASICKITQIQTTDMNREKCQIKQNKDCTYYIKSTDNETLKPDTNEQATLVPIRFSSLKAGKASNNRINGENKFSTPSNLSKNTTNSIDSSVNNEMGTKIDLLLQKLDNLTEYGNDEDHMFFKSILPIVKTLSPVNKLHLRMKINECLLQMVSGDSKPFNSVDDESVEKECGDSPWCEDLEDNKKDIIMDVTVDEAENDSLKVYNSDLDE